MDRIEFLRNKRNDLYQNYKKELNEIQNELDSLIFQQHNILDLKDKYIYYDNWYLKVNKIKRLQNGFELNGCCFENGVYCLNIDLDYTLSFTYEDQNEIKIISEEEFFNTLNKFYTDKLNNFKKWECTQN